MRTIKGPGIFLAQFIDESTPFNSLSSICTWAKDLGCKGVQIPTWDPKIFDLQKVAQSKTYAGGIRGLVDSSSLENAALCDHLQRRLVADNPTYDNLFVSFAPEAYHYHPKARTEWSVEQIQYAAKASDNLGLKAH